MDNVKKMEVIDLESEDESSNAKEDKDPQKVSKKLVVTCINFKCPSGVNMKTAPSFACSYYGVNMAKKKKRFICEKCLEAAIAHQEVLVNALLNKKPLLKCEFPDHTMEVEISDSDESGSEMKDSSCGSLNTFFTHCFFFFLH